MKLSQEHFEETVFNEYFIRSIRVVPKLQTLAIRQDALTKEQLLEKTEKDYVREEISAMWFGYKLAMKAQDETL